MALPHSVRGASAAPPMLSVDGQSITDTIEKRYIGMTRTALHLVCHTYTYGFSS